MFGRVLNTPLKLVHYNQYYTCNKKLYQAMDQITFRLGASTAQNLPKSLFPYKVWKFKIGSVVIDVLAARKFLDQQRYVFGNEASTFTCAFIFRFTCTLLAHLHNIFRWNFVQSY